MKRAVVLNIVGLTRSLIGDRTPNLKRLADRFGARPVHPAFPAVTCSAQSDYVTGQKASVHGIVGNGWYNRELAEVQFWKQPDQVVRAPKIWEELREKVPGFTCAKLFWWYNMYSRVDFSITPRPMYPADGRKVFDIYTGPSNIRSDIKRDLGEFPFPGFWGPAAGVKSPQGSRDMVSKWIAESAKWIERKHSPTLSLVYLPHLDYNLQRLGPDSPLIARDLQEIDNIAGDLIEFFEKRDVRVAVVSEYGIGPVDRPVHLNRVFRGRGWISIREELGKELLDAGASQAFAVADHQVAHVYVKDARMVDEVRQTLAAVSGVEKVLGAEEKAALGIAHDRAGDLIAIASPRAWFTYYYWTDDERAPDFARCVDIHRKPGYDPVELFLDPAQKLVKAKIFWKLARKRMGFRMLMDVIPLDAGLVKGSHGRIPEREDEWPVWIGEGQPPETVAVLESTDIYSLIKNLVL